MPDQNQTTQTNPTISQPTTPLAETPSPIPEKPEKSEKSEISALSATAAQVVGKIDECHNILIALSSDPSVDEIAAAIGLALHLDRMGKRATAIYSGHTPNALEFLKPDETFESSADVLQDFVIALNKEKADHLRYKLDGEYVKIYITPYRSRISEEDLDFSYGDYNVDLVLALGVSNGIDLDSALREHGRIMHDAVIVNITTGNPGKFGEIEWSDKNTSSVSEMLANLLYNIDNEVRIDPDEATAFLTGIVAATDRFSKANTSAATMELASRLMDSGAKHQLISKNITADLDNRLYNSSSKNSAKPSAEEGTTEPGESIDVSHTTESSESSSEETKSEQPKQNDSDTSAEPSLLEELKTAETNLAMASAETTPDIKQEPVSLDKLDDVSPVAEPDGAPSLTTPDSATASEEAELLKNTTEKVVAPSADFSSAEPENDANKYGKMLEEALAESKAPSAPVPSEPTPAPSMASPNPAASIAPPVASAPEINGIPDINYAPATGEQVLPPPPAPPVSMDNFMPEPSAPETQPTEPIPAPAPETPEPPLPTPPTLPTPSAPEAPLPSSPDIVPAPAPSASSPSTPPAPAPDAFRIPGM